MSNPSRTQTSDDNRPRPFLERGLFVKWRMREKLRNEKAVKSLKTNNPAKSVIQRL
jgi:hypothetical protein